jgi:gentisate 1,2-dioxygenase
MADNSEALAALEKEMAAANLRGQWQSDANRPRQRRQGPQNQLVVEPVAAGQAHLWRWSDMRPLLERSVTAMPESFTARRSLTLKNPGLARGTTQTMVAGYQMIGPGEISWAHRHSISALRFIIEGGDKVFTVVNGEKQAMEPYDLVLTPGWCWHDHHNQTDRPAVWLDALDVPFVLALNQDFYEELGETSQDQIEAAEPSPVMRRVGETATGRRVMRYPWAEAKRQIMARAAATPDPQDGILLEYLNSTTGGPALNSLSCRLTLLPPGFSGRVRRRSASSIYFGIAGEGRLVTDESALGFGPHDSFAVPNWSWYRLVNASKTTPALLFSITDQPILETFGLYREETEAQRH